MKNEQDKDGNLSVVARDARDFALLVARSLCRFPEGMSFQVYETPNRVTLAPRCVAEDGGRIIGHAGEVFRAFKRLMDMWSDRTDAGVKVELSSVKTPNGEEKPAVFHEDARWDVKSWLGTMGALADVVLGKHGSTVQGDGPVVVTYWVQPWAMDRREVDDAAAVLDTIGRAIAKTLGGEVAVDVGVRKGTL